jgi:hypothetical protein
MVENFSPEGLVFDDGRGRYPDVIKAPARSDARSREASCRKRGISAGELIRRAVMAYIDGDKGSRETRAA